MCGIFGAVFVGGWFRAPDFARFWTLLDLVQHRGPDARGAVGLDVKGSGCPDRERFDVFLGHRRLAIIDLSQAAHQPLTDNRGHWITYNGEIFNYVELRRELEAEGRCFHTASDTEVILHVYDRWGEEGFQRLNGMWAFAIVDIPRRRIVLSRDRFSIKPLYYTQFGEHLFFASEIKQLLPLLARREPNMRALFLHLEQGVRDHDEATFFHGISKVRPRHNLVLSLDNGALAVRPYWTYGSVGEPLPSAEAIERFRELFVDSVRIRLRSDVKVGALLSGGLDSSAISVVADGLLGGKLATFSIASRVRGFNEERFIRILTGQRRMRNTMIPFDLSDTRECLRLIQTMLYHHDEPFGGLSPVAHYKMLESVKRESDVTVLLSGQGGDEVLLGYLKYFLFHIQHLLRKGKLVSAASALLASLAKRTMIVQFRFDEAKRYLPILSRREPKTWLLVTGELEPVWRCTDLRDRQVLDLDRYTVPSLTHYEDRTSMAHSLEIRLPFLDHRLVDFALALPVDLKLRGGWSKYVLRAAIPELPEEIRWRRDKQGFLIPERPWLQYHLADAIRSTFRRSLLEEMGVISAEGFLQYYERFRNGSPLIWYTEISRTLIAELWARQHWGTEARAAASIR